MYHCRGSKADVKEAVMRRFQSTPHQGGIVNATPWTGHNTDHLFHIMENYTQSKVCYMFCDHRSNKQLTANGLQKTTIQDVQIVSKLGGEPL